jgi:Cellulase (glycosyl hydrolase family 5)
MKRSQRAIVPTALALVLVGAVLSLTCTNQPQTTDQRGARAFHVQGNRIIGPDGRPFTVKGATTGYGAFDKPCPEGNVNSTHTTQDMDAMKALGMNTVRLFVEGKQSRTMSNYLAKIDQFVQAAAQRRLVIELTDSYTDDFNWVDTLNRQLATKYRNNPNVWIEPYNEPHGGDQSWADWRKEETRWVQTIRNAGFANPVVINTPDWSNDISQIPQYHLADDNIIYAWHRYAGGHTFDQSKEDQAWASATLSSKFAIIGDEVGAYNGDPATVNLQWNRDVLDYAVDWVKNKGGNGVIAFTWRWCDDNTMSDGGGREQLTEWGTIFKDHFLTPLASFSRGTTAAASRVLS